jgi:hypothetical protein
MPTLHYYSVCIVPPLVPVLCQMFKSTSSYPIFCTVHYVSRSSKIYVHFRFLTKTICTIAIAKLTCVKTVALHTLFPSQGEEHCSHNEIDLYLTG